MHISRSFSLALTTVAVGLAAAAPGALAQTGGVIAPGSLREPNANFDVNRLRPAMGREGILNVPSAEVPKHLAWDLALWLNWVDDPVVLTELGTDGRTQRVVSLLKGRFEAHLMGSIGIFDWVQVGIDLPITLYQWRNRKATDRFGLMRLNTMGFGDLGIRSKVRILNRKQHHVDVAFLATLTLPTAIEKNNYFGERSLTLDPEIVTSTLLWDDRLELAGSFAARLRDWVMSDPQSTRIGHELILRLGATLHLEKLLGVPVTGSLSFEGFTQAAHPFASASEGGAEVLFGFDYEVTEIMTAYVGGGFPLASAYSIPDFRAFFGLRFSERHRDADGDGVVDANDRCPDQREDRDGYQDMDGCPDPDNDGDGFLDGEDAAPNEPEDVDGFEDDDGAPDLDNDGDGILDVADGAPLLPEDADGFEDDDGIPDPDNDLDGLADAEERCPNEAEDYDGFQDGDGCPDLDNDNDGVPDALDAAPLSAEDRDGFEDDDGAPDPDNDMDGFGDDVDNCPLQAEVINGVDDDDGCPDVGKSLTKITGSKIEILEKVYFDVGKARIKERSASLLNQVAAVLRANPQVTRLRIEGHTDSRGPAALNKRLSQARAEAVREFLIAEGVAGERLDAVGFGEERPLANNISSRGREANRRVEFVITEVNGERVGDSQQLPQERVP